jgi:hypothetical protein
MFGLLSKHLSVRIARAVAEPGFAGTGEETSAIASYRMKGFVSGSRVATQLGWRPVEAVTVGDRVMTFDNGMQKVVAVTRNIHFATDDQMPEFACPIRVPAGAIGNDNEMTLLPEQCVMIESDAAEAISGDPFALVPARALIGFRGIERMVGQRPVEVVTLHFTSDEVVFADGGALIYAPCDIPGTVSVDFYDCCAEAPYATYTTTEARALVAAMAREDACAYAASARMVNAA